MMADQTITRPRMLHMIISFPQVSAIILGSLGGWEIKASGSARSGDGSHALRQYEYEGMEIMDGNNLHKYLFIEKGNNPQRR